MASTSQARPTADLANFKAIFPEFNQESTQLESLEAPQIENITDRAQTVLSRARKLFKNYLESLKMDPLGNKTSSQQPEDAKILKTSVLSWITFLYWCADKEVLPLKPANSRLFVTNRLFGRCVRHSVS